MVSNTPFGANRKWLATKFESYCKGDKLGPLDWKSLDELFDHYSPEQIYMAMGDYRRICEKEKRYIDFRGFGFYSRVSGNVPSRRLAEAYCLTIHFPRDVLAKQIYHDTLTADESWCRSADLENKIKGYAEKIAEYKLRL